MKVLKFGGTSVGSPERMRRLLDIINPNERQIVVLSAVSGTTNSLVEISEAYKVDKNKAVSLIDNLKSKYIVFIQDLFPQQEFYAKGNEIIETHFATIYSFANEASFTPAHERAILAQGELISTNLYTVYLNQIGIDAVLLPALDFMKIDEESEPIVPFITEKLTPLLEANPTTKLFITQGFICRNPFGEIDNLKRGGSDYTASLIGAGITAEEVQIWTDIDGMHNNDPRIVKNTRPIARLSFEEAAELAYFGAKILHPQSVLPAQKYKIPVRLKNTMDPTAPGTLIDAQRSEGEIKAVAAKDGITAVKIQSSRMLMAYGFLRRVFEIFERYKTPIDVITTSEVAVSVTIDKTDNLKDIIEELADYGAVEVDKDLTIICIVGDFVSSKTGYAARVINSLKEVPMRMISYGGSNNNISIIVDSSFKHSALQDLHEGLFN
ncbi:aspartate kinase [Solitalea canadensis]|uniref:Aspartokinase n=1 Tax=Solitalea canadensis (strain ATCC 29591 / DSM 3403 / JCM 21819 / LMG 8368 / NBRC 15130 / NCIMB 12057 / USAM 9D) TaxID=929556 RepID=H8KQT1_SOLCM|nr:aspartate kinase [Solitalea canadensis]AFD06952.1 aspartate kinase [Solitalea canadensis DSM 3403]